MHFSEMPISPTVSAKAEPARLLLYLNKLRFVLLRALALSLSLAHLSVVSVSAA